MSDQQPKMPEDDDTAAHRKVEATKAFCLGWLERLGDLRTADEAYDDDMHKLQRELDTEKERICTPGLDRHEMARIAERMLELRVQLRDLETSRDSTSDSRKKAHRELRRAQLGDLVAGIVRITGETSSVTPSSGQVALPTSPPQPQPSSCQVKLPTSKLDHQGGPKKPKGGEGNSTNALSKARSAALPEKSQKGPPLEKENASTSFGPGNASQPPTSPARPTPESGLSLGRRSAPKRRAAVESDNARRAGLGGTALDTAAETADESPSRPTKRRRTDAHPNDEEEPVDLPSELQPQPGSFAKKAIHYDDVHQNGLGEYRHFIVEHKGKYYICICEEHGLHFKGDILRGVGTHINSPKHNCASRSFVVALEMLGVQVLGCNSRLADKHNRMLTAAIEKGEYAVLDWCNLPRDKQDQTPLSSCGLEALKRSGAALRQGKSGTASSHPKVGTASSHPKAGTASSVPKVGSAAGRRRASRAQQQKSFKGVIDIVPGKPYFGQRSDGMWYGLIALPRGEVFGDPSFEEISLPSALADTQVLRTVPGCYAYSRFQRRYLGWDEGFEDSGASVTRREFPVIFFDGRPFPSQSQVAWISAQDLRPYNLMGPNAAGVPHLHSFGKLLKERRKKDKDEIEVEGDEEDEDEEDGDTDQDDQDESGDEGESAGESNTDDKEEEEQRKGKEKGKGSKGDGVENPGEGARQRPQTTNGPTKETTRDQGPAPLRSGVDSASSLPPVQLVQLPPQPKNQAVSPTLPTLSPRLRRDPESNNKSSGPMVQPARPSSQLGSQEASANASRVPPSVHRDPENTGSSASLVQPAQPSAQSNYKEGGKRVSSMLSSLRDTGSDTSSPRPGQSSQPLRHPDLQQSSSGNRREGPAGTGQGNNTPGRRGAGVHASKPVQRGMPKGNGPSDEPSAVRSDITETLRKPLPQDGRTGGATTPTGSARSRLNRPLKAFKAASKATPTRGTPIPTARATPLAPMPTPTPASAASPAGHTNRSGIQEAHFIVSQSGQGNRSLTSTSAPGPSLPVNRDGRQGFKFSGSQFDTTRDVPENVPLPNEPKLSQAKPPAAPLSPNLFPPNLKPHATTSVTGGPSNATSTPGNRASMPLDANAQQRSAQKPKHKSHGLGSMQKTTNAVMSSSNSGASRDASPLVLTGQPGVQRPSEAVSTASTASKSLTPRPPNSARS